MRKQAGFTLAEIAVVVLLIGIALSMGLKMVTATMENASLSDTRAKQERIKLALVGFLRANGRMPCPDSNGGVPTGAEPAACAAVNGYGVLPWQALGLPRDAVIDGWGHFFSYRVANIPAAVAAPVGPTPVHRFANQNWVARPGFDIRAFAAAPAVGFQSLTVQNRDPGPALTIESRTAIAVIISHGRNGLGAKTTRVGARIAGAAADEATNATLGSVTFVRRPITDNVAAPGGAFDDIVAYLTPQDLLQPLIAERTLLGACAAYCTGGGPAPCATTVAPIPIGATGPGLACP